MNKEQLKSKIIREVVILYFDYLMTNEKMENTDLYNLFFHKWYKKLLPENIDLLSIHDLELLQKELDTIFTIYYKSPSSGQKMSMEHLNHSLNKYMNLQIKKIQEQEAL